MKFQFEEINGKIKKILEHEGYVYISDKLVIIDKNKLDIWLKFKKEGNDLFFDSVFFIFNNTFPTEEQIVTAGA